MGLVVRCPAQRGINSTLATRSAWLDVRRLLHILFFIFMAGALLTIPAPTIAAPAPDYDASIVEITVTYQDHDPQIPWRRKAAAVRHGYGVFISAGQVLTTEDLVRNQTQVELRRAKSGAKLAATVLEADEQLNAALLTFSNSATANAVAAANTPVPITAASPTGLTVSLAVSACISGSAAPPTMAPIVSRMT